MVKCRHVMMIKSDVMKLDLYMHGKINYMQAVKSYKHNSDRTCKFVNGKIQQLQHAKQDINIHSNTIDYTM